jgi:alkylation response protein AidB-like acyl-CoA dehydrogenase
MPSATRCSVCWRTEERSPGRNATPRRLSGNAVARLLLLSAAESLQATGERRETVTLEQRALLRAAMAHAAQVSRQALVAMYELASSSAVSRGNPIERYFRDVMAALQHANQ